MASGQDVLPRRHAPMRKKKGTHQVQEEYLQQALVQLAQQQRTGVGVVVCLCTVGVGYVMPPRVLHGSQEGPWGGRARQRRVGCFNQHAKKRDEKMLHAKQRCTW